MTDSDKMVIGIVGQKAVGKDTVARHIAQKYNGSAHSHSEILVDILKVLGIPANRINEMKLVDLRKTFGPDTLINALNKRISHEPAKIVAVTGIRFQNELENISRHWHGKTIYVSSTVENRYKWQVLRREKTDDATMTFPEFMEIDKRETEAQIKELGQQCDYTIENHGTLEGLYAETDAVINQILKK